jgi:septal ring-binding cell division protein DamX
MSMTQSTQNKQQVSWFKDNVSGILLLLCILIIIIAIVIYSMPQSISDLEAERETVGTNYTLVDTGNKQDVIEINNDQVMPEPGSTEHAADNWPEDAIMNIDNSTLVVGESDHNGQRIVISEQEIFGLDKSTDKNAGDEQSLAKPATTREVQSSDSLATSLNNELNNAKQPWSENDAGTAIGAALGLILTPKEQLLAISPYLYTVRLSETSSAESLLQFLELHSLPQEGIYIYQTIRSNKPWFVVIYGQFDSFQLAKKAGVALASSSSELSTWVEMYETIHQDLRLVND